MPARHPSRAIIDLNAYRSNLELVRRFVGKRAHIIPVLKANAYGHGLVPLSKAARDAGATMLCVATVEEAIQLREHGVNTPLLVMIQPPRDALPLYIEHKLTLMVSEVAMAEAMGALGHEANRVMPVHCKVDTGMGRQGILLDEALEAIQYIARITHIDLQGICTHFPIADVTEDTFTFGQIKAFKQLMKQVEKRGIPYEMAHAANSAAIVNYGESIFDAVRPGLITYGIWPTVTSSNASLIKPVLRWETTVVQLRNLPPDTSIGYGRTYTTARPTRTAVLPVGYADGYRHALGNRAEVLIRGHRCPVRGAVSMDQIVVDVSDLPQVETGDMATLIGSDGDQRITVEELAHKADTIPYDILTGIGPRVHREYVGSDTRE